jgi:D-3-phosphoglycerate dehydrogenase / 2-oxoglutarate reductase
VTILLLEDGYPPELLEGFTVVRAPQDDVVAVLTIDEPVDVELMDRLSSLRVVATATVGFDHIDTDAAEARGIAVVSVPDYCTHEVADHALALLYALTRGVVALDADVRRGAWNPKAAGPLRTLAELRVGIIGLGRIGNAVATRLLALGATVWANDIVPVARVGVQLVGLDELLAECDAITLHVPLTRETRNLIGRSQLAAMKPGAYLVNTARGAVVDVGAVLEALRAGRLAGAALDVLPREPPPVAPLAPRLVLTPHAAWYSDSAEERSYRLAVARVRELLGA